MENQSAAYTYGTLTEERLSARFSDTISSVKKVAGVSELTDVSGGGPGDFKSPVPFSYHSSRTTSWNGTTRLHEVNSGGAWNLTYTDIGPSPSFMPWGGYAFGEPPDTSAVYNEAVYQLASRMRSGSLDLGSDMAEARANARESEKRMSRVSHYAPRGNKPFLPSRVPIGLLKIGSRAWLAWQYAIKPAVSSAFDAATFKLRSDPEVVVTKSRAKREFVEKVLDRYGDMYCDRTRTTYVEEALKVRYRISNVELANLARTTSLNPALWAWNTIPLSFVVDWFVNVSGYMEAVEHSLGLGLNISSVERSSFLRRNEERILFGEFTQTVAEGYRQNYFADARWSRNRTWFTRSVGLSLPVPRLTPHLLGDEFRMGRDRMISSAALLATFLRR
jgi:hypothetical protein